MRHSVDVIARELDFAALLHFRTALRQFNRWSEAQATTAGLTHIQHQLLLAIKGHADPRGPTIGEAAGYLLVKHHTVGELATRVEALGFLCRGPDTRDGRIVRLTLTPAGESAILALTEVHVRELQMLAPLLKALVEQPVRNSAGEIISWPATSQEGWSFSRCQP